MINEIDIKDWQMLTEPLQLKELKEKDLFSFEGSDCIFEYYAKLGERIIATFHADNIPITFTFPEFIKVYKWQKLV